MSLGVLISVDGFKSNSSIETEAVYSPGTTYSVSDTTAELNSYYSSITSSMSGDSLLSALRSLNSTKRKKTIGYSTMGTTGSSSPYVYTDYPLGTTTTDSNGQIRSNGNIASFYTKTTSSGFNREHVWPNSHGGDEVEDDILHTRPTISSENSSRGNSFYVEGISHSSNGWDPYTAGYDAACRGECARIILYSVVACNKFTLSDANSHSTSNSNPDNMMGNMNTLIKWHFDYSPSVYELNRNNGAEYLQGNRNPFVDHPEYVARIWSSFNSTVSNLCANNASMYDNWVPGTASTYGTNDAVNFTGVNISKTSASLAVDATTTISATSSDSSSITWTTSNSSVASISSGSATSGANITITGVSAGTATITAKATISGTQYTKTCTVTVSASGGSGGSGSTGSYSLITSNSTLSNGDKVVLTTDQTANTITGVTGWNSSKDATVSTTESEWKQFIVGSASNNGFTLKDDSANQYIASPTGNEFKYSSSAGTVSVDNTGKFVCNSRYLCINGTNYRCYTSVGSYTPFYIYQVNSSSSTKTLSSISVSTAPAKTNYTAGEYFDPTGLVITRTYSDGTSDTYAYSGHTSEFGFSPNTSTALTTSNKSVTITYSGKSTTQAITVSAAKTLSSISVSTAPSKTIYIEGQNFDPTGLVIRRTYSDSTYDIYTYVNHTSEFTFSPTTSTSLTTSHTSVTITYSGKSTSQSITVSAKSLSSIEVSNQKTTFTKGETFSFGGTVTATFNNDTTADVTSSASFSGYNLNTLGNQMVTVSYTLGGITKQTTYSITVNPNRVVVEETTASGTITWSSSAATVAGMDNVTVTNVQYTYYESDSLRLGTGSGGGQIRIDTSINVVSVVVTAKAYSDTRKGNLTVGDKTLSVTNTDYVEFSLLTLTTPTASLVVSTPSSSVRINIQSIVINCVGSEDISTSSDCIGLETFIETYMHMDYVQNLGYCKDNQHHYYSSAKSAFNSLNTHQRKLFVENSAYSSEYTRLSAWASANGESLNSSNQFGQHPNSSIFKIGSEQNNAYILIIILSLVGLSTIGLCLYIRKRKSI